MGSSILISLRETHNISRITILNMNKFIVAVALFGAVMGDGGSHHAPAAHDSGYAAPADAYASPAAEYAPPSFHRRLCCHHHRPARRSSLRGSVRCQGRSVRRNFQPPGPAQV